MSTTPLVELSLTEEMTTKVYSGAGVLEAALAASWRDRWKQVAVIADENVLQIHGATLTQTLTKHTEQMAVLGFAAGEDNKTRQTKEALENRLIEQGFDRSCCIVAFGGGISLDMAGYVAATYLRGVDYIGVPTTLLAQADACLGGKTGVNAPQGKNLIGVIHQPRAVIADTRWLSTLPLSEWRCGLAEAIKVGLIADEKLFDWMEREASALRNPDASELTLEHLVGRCLAIKGSIVQRDPRERGERVVLNFGHTFGHAIERASKHRFGHGLSVARGMLAEAEVARRLVSFPERDQGRLAALIESLEIGVKTVDLPFSELLPFIVHDKKRRGDELRVVLPQRCGTIALGRDGSYSWPAPVEALESAWDATA